MGRIYRFLIWPDFLDIIPIFHYSEGKDNGRAHKDMADELPKNFGKEVLFDVELKSKDIAILDILRRLENDNWIDKRNCVGQ